MQDNLDNKMKSRKVVNFDSYVDETMDHVYEGVGIVRTEAFDIDEILPYFPEKRSIFKAEETLSNILVNSDDIVFAKTRALGETGKADRIINNLKSRTQKEAA